MRIEVNTSFKVTIVMPAYNSESAIKYVIKYVINQDYPNWELIIVDDGSKDKTYKICKKYAIKDSRIRVFHYSNNGPSYARNKALDKVTGDLLIFLDSDDTLVQHALSTLVPYFKDDNLDLCIYAWNKIQNQSIEVHKFSNKEIRASKEQAFRNIGYSLNWEAYGGGYPWNKIWRVSTLKKSGTVYFNEQVKLLEDRLYTLEALDKVKKIKYVNIPLYNYVIQKESTSHSANMNLMLNMNFEVYRAMKLEYKYIVKYHSSAIDIAKKTLLQGQINYLVTAKKCTLINNKVQFLSVKNDFMRNKFQFLNFKYSVKYFLLKFIYC